MQKFGTLVQTFMTPLVVLGLAGVVAYDHMAPRSPVAPASAVHGKALGRAFAPTVASDLGDAWLAAADALEQGKTISDAQAALQSTWQAARVKSFAAQVSPEFSKVLPEGAEPT